MMMMRNHCPGCLSTTLSVVYRERFSSPDIQSYLRRQYAGRNTSVATAGDYALARCGRCGLTFQQQVPDGQLLRELYEDWVSDSNLACSRGDYDLDDYRYLAEQVGLIIQHFGISPSRINILDFGFGWAQFSRMAMGYGCNVSGAELSGARISHGRSIGLKIVELDHLPKGEFQFINTEQVFEHLTEPRFVLERLLASLASDGLIKISVPDAAASLKQIGKRQSFGALSAAQQMSIAPLEHINCFSRDSLMAFGREFGLKPLRPRFSQLVNSASGLLRPKYLARTLLRPVYRHILSRGTFVYFTRG
ncbi:MAG: Methyltransferase type 12 [Burkholderiaceae bacterium]|jgi:transcription elongation factor Elf1|nr:MAG: Methyltransferase type 12 [Burkholderiaceae bacterium]